VSEAPQDWRQQARRLARCSFLPGSWDKRFARDLAARAEDPEATITEKQAAALARLTQRYRRQLGRAE
jgi:hypothetical protein